MSKAYQCDRCGIMFLDKTVGIEDNIRIITHGGIELDLCCDCVREFNRWWRQENDA